MKRRTKLILVLIAILVGLPVLLVAYPWIYMLGAGRLWDKAEHEVHLLPTGFTGPVVILLGDSTAPAPERENGARLFRIPLTGVLHSQLQVNQGWGLPDYYYADTRGHRTKLVSGAPCERDLEADPIQACLLGHTTFSSLPDRAYQAYVVGRRADQKRWEWPAEHFVDSVVYDGRHR
jgi:hypothetical protein